MPIDTMDAEYGALHLVHILKQIVILEQQTVLALLFRWWSIVGLTDRTVGKTDRTDHQQTDKKIALLSEQFGAPSVEYITPSGNGWME